MKKIAAIGIALIFVFFSFFSCEKKPSAPKAGSASADDMLSLIPAASMGVFFVDFHKAMSTEIVSNAIKEDKNYQKYQEFVEMTGVDPQKDVYFVAVSVTEAMEKEKTKGAAIINLKYDKETLLSLIKAKAAEEGQELQEEEYSGVLIYAWKEENGDKPYFSFIDDSNIIAGDDTGVKSIIDVLQKKKENVFKNEALSALIEKANKDVLLWGAILIPPEAMSKAASQNPMLSSLEGINAVSMYFDYKNKNIIAEIKVISSDEAKNQQVADLLNGLKAMGGMAATEKPEIGELINKIEITSTADHVKIYASIPEDLINKLKEMEKKEEENL